MTKPLLTPQSFVVKKILIVEDSNEILENTSEILELAGYTVATAVNGADG
jgi:CheY-like chemotaxis protein